MVLHRLHETGLRDYVWKGRNRDSIHGRLSAGRVAQFLSADCVVSSRLSPGVEPDFLFKRKIIAFLHREENMRIDSEQEKMKFVNTINLLREYTRHTSHSGAVRPTTSGFYVTLDVCRTCA